MSTFGLSAAALTQACSDAASPKPQQTVVEAPSAPSRIVATAGGVPANECAAPSSAWIFCDDFESDRTAKYYEYDGVSGKFARKAAAGWAGSYGMRGTFTRGQTNAGHLSLAFGKVPDASFRPIDAGVATYREVYWRFFVRREPGWAGNGAGAMTRAMSFAGSNWSQAMIAYGWTDPTNSRYLRLDAASGIDAQGKLVTVGFNDAAHLHSLGSTRSAAAEEDASKVGTWSCYEFHIKLNDAGASNGVYEMSVDGQTSARQTGMNWVGSYSTYGINSLSLVNLANAAVTAAESRTMDNFVVSTAPIGCSGTTTTPPPPATVATVAVSLDSASVTVPHQAHATATLRDASGKVMTGAVTWTSSNTTVATVSSTGVVTSVGAGTANIVGTSNGKTGQATITVVAATVPVATVAVSLTATTLTVGGTTQAKASALDAAGNVLTGRPIAWSSSNTAVATVVATTGVVTAVGAGSANIVATSGSVTGKATVTVTSATTPPPPSSSALFNEGFEDTNLGGRGWYDMAGTAPLSTDHTGGTHSLQVAFAAGASSPSPRAGGRHLFTPSGSVYLRYWVKYSSNWVGSGKSYHPHEFHILTNEDDQYAGPAYNYLTTYIEANFQNGVGTAVLSTQDARNIDATRLNQDLTNITENRAVSGCNGNPEGITGDCYASGGYNYNGRTLRSASPVFLSTAGASYKGDWHQVEAYFQLNSIVNGKGQRDGVAQYWFDGKLVIDRHDLYLRTGAHPNMKFNQLLLAPYIGDGSPVAQTMWIDDISVATSRP